MNPLLKKALIIYNPVSGWMPSKANLFDLIQSLSELNFISEVVMTTRDMDLIQVIKELAPNIDLIVCCGGDGTLHEVINAIVKNDLEIPLGYLPIGTTNDFGSTHGIPHDFNKAFKILSDGKNKTLDIGSFNGNDFFTYIACFGIFTKLTYEASQPLKNSLGQLAYFIEGTKEIGDFTKGYHMIVEAEGETYEGDYIFGGVVNSLTVGGFLSVPITIDELSDGYLEVILIDLPKNFFEFQNLAGAVITNGFNSDSNENIKIFKTKKVTFKSEKPIAWNLDGEYAGELSEVTIEVKENGLNIIL